MMLTLRKPPINLNIDNPSGRLEVQFDHKFGPESGSLKWRTRNELGSNIRAFINRKILMSALYRNNNRIHFDTKQKLII